MILHIAPAYGRDYKKLGDAQADWDAGKDFVIQDMHHPFDGKPTNKEQNAGAMVMLRYGNQRKVGRIKNT